MEGQQQQPPLTAAALLADRDAERRARAAERRRLYRERRRAEREADPTSSLQQPVRAAPSARPTVASYACAGEEEMMQWLDQIVQRRLHELLLSEDLDDARSTASTVRVDEGADAVSVGPAPSEAARSGLSLLFPAASMALLPMVAPLLPRLVSLCVTAIVDVLKARVTGAWGGVRDMVASQVRLPHQQPPRLQEEEQNGPQCRAGEGRPAAGAQ